MASSLEHSLPQHLVSQPLRLDPTAVHTPLAPPRQTAAEANRDKLAAADVVGEDPLHSHPGDGGTQTDHPLTGMPSVDLRPPEPEPDWVRRRLV